MACGLVSKCCSPPGADCVTPSAMPRGMIVTRSGGSALGAKCATTHGVPGFVHRDALLLEGIELGFARITEHDLVVGREEIGVFDRVRAAARGG